MTGPILTDINGVQTFGEIEVELQRAAAPFAAYGIADDESQFRSVERAVARRNRIRHTQFLERLLQPLFRLIPEFIGTDTVFGPHLQFYNIIVEAEILVDRLGQFAEFDR